MPKLEDKRWEEFCQQYVIDFNGARSARDAGFSAKGNGARVQASYLLSKQNIQKRIAELMKNRSERTQITQDMVLQELAVVGFSDFRDYGHIKKDGNLKLFPFDEIEGEKTRAIESIKQTTSQGGGSISVKLHGKIKPLELLGKHTGLFVDTHNVNLTGEIKVVSAVPRPKKKKEKK